MATLTPVESPSCCVVCNKKPTYPATPGEPVVKLFLCGRCKLARYCGNDCQRSHWETHKEYCIRVGSNIYYEVPEIPDLPHDVALPTNPLNLRHQPPLLTPEHIAALCAKEQVAREQFATKKREDETFEDKVWYVAPHIEAFDPLLKKALAWLKSGNDSSARIAHLAGESKEDLVELLRRNIYEQIRTNDELKALSMMNQSNQLHATAVRKRIFGEQDGRHSSERIPEIQRQEMMPEMVAARDASLDCIKATDYMYGFKQCEHIKAEWLLHSLLAKNPLPPRPDRNPLSLLTEDRLTETKIPKKIIRLLIAIGARGIDEGHFWELDDRRDSLRLTVNHTAVTKVASPLDANILTLIIEGMMDCCW